MFMLCRLVKKVDFYNGRSADLTNKDVEGVMVIYKTMEAAEVARGKGSCEIKEVYMEKDGI